MMMGIRKGCCSCEYTKRSYLTEELERNLNHCNKGIGLIPSGEFKNICSEWKLDPFL